MSFREELERRAAGWVDDGVISPAQRDAMLATTPEVEGVWSRRLVPGLAILGAVVVLAGLILLVGANWSEIPRTMKLAAGVVLLVAFHAAGYWVAFGPLSRRSTGVALMFVGSGVFLGDLALISQQYNVEPNPSRLILLTWLLGAAAMPYLFGSRLFAFGSMVVLIAGLATEAARDLSPLEADALAGLLMFTAVGVGIVTYGAAHRLSDRYGQLAAPIEVAGGAVVLALVYVLGFYRHYVDGGDARVVYEGGGAAVVLIGVPTAFVVAVAIAWLRRADVRLIGHDRWSIASAVAVALALLGYLTVVLANPRELDESEFMVWTVGFWVTALLLPAVMIWLGVVFAQGWWTNIALAYLGLFVITRYFDLFGSYTQTGLVFIGAGFLLLGVAFGLERSRRLLATMTERST